MAELPQEAGSGSARPTPAGRIVVGVDGSPCSEAALRWAAREAAAHGSSLELVNCVPVRSGVVATATSFAGSQSDVALEELVALARAEAESAGRSVAVTTAVASGDPAQALVEIARSAELLVVGTRGHGPLVGALLGSVSQAVVRQAPCTVVVVPDANQVQEREAAASARELRQAEPVPLSQAEAWPAIHGDS